MTYLLDVNVLLAAIWHNHPLHERAFEGIKGKDIAVCPLAELGFIRISTNPKATINAPMDKARELLHRFRQERGPIHIADDLPALESKPAKSEDVTDSYLAELAVRHGMRLATMDSRLKHQSVALI
ncbi:MAG TPA: TA system VapC family ribonuclease toxin [Verrucomicrobiae bacterium]|nr:TA system VapC family ribonuclease toxin [Verrucomicrobiae bacterium]